jgi:outer membrane protein assembly factor BamA
MMMVRSLLAYFPCLLVCLAVARPGTLLAQYQKYDGKEVLTIQFDPVEQPVDPSELFEILPLKIHQPLTTAAVRASIERLFATGRYADIQVDAEAYQNGAIVRFLTVGSSATCRRWATCPIPLPGNWRTPRASTWASPTPIPGSRKP